MVLLAGIACVFLALQKDDTQEEHPASTEETTWETNYEQRTGRAPVHGFASATDVGSSIVRCRLLLQLGPFDTWRSRWPIYQNRPGVAPVSSEALFLFSSEMKVDMTPYSQQARQHASS